MSSLSPATSMALFQPSASAPSFSPTVPASASPSSSGGNPLDVVTQRLAEQVADGKMSMEQGAALAQAWQQIEDIVSLSNGTGAAAFGPTDVNEMFAALRPALDIKA
jgi:hypothetical protein